MEPQLIDDMALVSPGFFSFAIIVANGTFVCDCFRKWIIPFAIVFANEEFRLRLFSQMRDSIAIIFANESFICDCFRKWIIPFAIVFANESSFAITIANESFVAKTFANQKPHYIAIRKLKFDIHSHSLS